MSIGLNSFLYDGLLSVCEHLYCR